jgi:hypothetical protein
MTTREELVEASKAAQAVYYAAYAAAGNDPFGAGCKEAYRAMLIARAAVEAHDDAVIAAERANKAVTTVRRASGGRVVRTTRGKSWTEY